MLTRERLAQYRELASAGALALVGVAVFLSATASRAPISSVEMRFAENSPNGMQIIPASCPSEPDIPGHTELLIHADFTS